MITKEVGLEDVPEIVELTKQQPDFFLPDIDNCVIDRIIYQDGIPVAYGIVREMAEAIILVNYKMPKISRMKALKELMSIAIFGATRKGHHQLHVFVKDDKLAELLKNKFGFVQTQDIVLVRNL